MKKRILVLMVLCSVLLCQPVMAMGEGNYLWSSVGRNMGIMPLTSDCIKIFNGDVDYLGSSTLNLIAHIEAADVDKVEIIGQVQSFSNGKWTDKGTALKVSSKNASVKMDKERVVPDGKYRVKYTFNAYIGSKVVETRKSTTSSVTVKK